MKAIVTGGAGFIGSNLTKRLLDAGWKVLVVDNLSTGEKKSVDKRAQFVRGDVANKLLVDVLVSSFRPDTIFHTAAVARTMETVENPHKANETNIKGTLNLLWAAKRFGVKRFVYSSSSILYVPNTPYFVGKQAGEAYTSVFNKVYGLSTVSLRYANVYGAGQSENGSYPNVFASFRRDREKYGEIRITGDGHQERDFIHVHDVVEANILAAFSDKVGAYDICTGKQTSLNTIAPMFGCKIVYVEDRPGDTKSLPLDPRPAEESFGFRARITLEEGLKDIV